MGYEKYPDYVLPARMAQNYENLEAFLKDLEKQIRPLADAEMKEYLALKKEMTGEESQTLNAWETAYWPTSTKSGNMPWTTRKSKSISRRTKS